MPRCWLVERSFGDKNIVSLVYATPEGEYEYTRELPKNLLARTDVTAARDVEEDPLQRVSDPETRERYATEASRMAAKHDPDDPV